MKLEDFTEQEQKQIKKGLTFSVISDRETADRILSLVPEELMKKIPFFVRIGFENYRYYYYVPESKE